MKRKKQRPEPEAQFLTGVEKLEAYRNLDALKFNAAIEVRRVLDDICGESDGYFQQEDFDRDVLQLVKDARD